MTKLSRVTHATRKVLAIGAMVFIGILILYFGIKIGLDIKESLHPTPPPPPTVAFGTLPAISFPTESKPIAFTYSVNTVTGDYPDFSDRAKVYRIEKPSPSLLALQKTQDNVKNMGYQSKPTTISDTLYQWVNSDPLTKTLIVNIQTTNFTLTSSYMNDATITGGANVPDQTTSEAITKNFLHSLQNFPGDIDDNKTKVSLFSIINGSSGLTPASSLSTAKIVRVDYFQQDVDKLPLVYAKPAVSPMYFLLGSSTSAQSPQIVEAHFFHQNITSDSATYPIKTAKQAFDSLQKGDAYIASSPNTASNITIRTISLGYFVSDSDMDYLMPVVILQGDNNFVAYVSSVDDKWIESGK